MTVSTLTGVSTESFQGAPWPPEVANQVVNLLVAGGPFANSLTRYPTVRNAVAWPTASPSGWAWRGELQELPTLNVADDAYIVAVAKLAAIVDLSNESIEDASVDLNALLGAVFIDSLSRDLDLGLLNGSGPPEPVGVIGAAPETSGTGLFNAAMTARGEIADSGGAPDTLAISGTALAAADGTVDSEGHLVYPSGIAAALGVTAVVVPELDQPLLYDSGRAFLVIRDDPTVETSSDFHFSYDATSMRIKVRAAAAIPNVTATIRKLNIGGEG